MESLAVDGVCREPVSEYRFPANREKYREICEFGLRIWPLDVYMPLNMNEFLGNWFRFSAVRNSELSPEYQGISIP